MRNPMTLCALVFFVAGCQTDAGRLDDLRSRESIARTDLLMQRVRLDSLQTAGAPLDSVRMARVAVLEAEDALALIERDIRQLLDD